MLFLFYWQVPNSLPISPSVFHFLHSSAICQSKFTVCFSLSPLLFFWCLSHSSFPLDVGLFMLSKESQWIAALPSTHTCAHTQIHRVLSLLQLLHHCSSLSNRILAFFFFPTQLPVPKSMFCYTDWSDSNVGDTSPTTWCTVNCSPKIPLC